VGTGGGPSKVAVPGGGGVAGEDEKTYDLDQLDFDNAEFEDLGGGRSRTTVPVRDPETGEVIDHVTYEEQAVGDVSELEPGQTATRIDHANQRLYEETTEGTKITNLTTGESVFLPRGSRGGE
jgi:hypothetical protein